MPEIDWREVLVALLLGVMVGEVGGWLPQFAAWIVRVLARGLPVRAARREAEWLEAVEETPGQWSKVLRALTFVPAVIAIRRHTPRPVGTVLKGSRGMRLLLGWTRLQASIVFLVIAFVDLTWVLFGVFSSSSVPLAGLLEMQLLAAFLYLLNWRGLGVDWPWLRTTPQGSAILLALGLWPFVSLPVVGRAPSQVLGMAWIITLYVLWAWEGYWDMRRPLLKRGLLGWKRKTPR